MSGRYFSKIDLQNINALNLFTDVHSRSPRYIHIHWCTLMFTDVHQCSMMFTDVHSHSPRYIHIHWCTLMFTDAQLCSLMYIRLHLCTQIWTHTSLLFPLCLYVTIAMHSLCTLCRLVYTKYLGILVLNHALSRQSTCKR